MPYVDDPGGLDAGEKEPLKGSVRDRVIALVTKVGGFHQGYVALDYSFASEADSLDTVELVMEFEEEFGITIPD
jgi:acyl carrier protein